MKRQLNAPSLIPQKKPEMLFRNLVWLQDLEEDTVSYIMAQAELISYEYGETMIRQGEPSDGIYVIISGMVKVRSVCSRFRLDDKTLHDSHLRFCFIQKKTTFYHLWSDRTCFMKSVSLFHFV